MSHARSPVLRKLRLPLTLCLALLLSGVVLIVGTVLGFHTYRQTARIVESGADALLAETAREVALELDRDVVSARLLVEVVAAQTITRAATLDERLRELPAFARALDENRALSAVYVGYRDGSFFLLRAIRDDSTRAALEAPPDARFVVQSIARGSEGHGDDVRFLYFRDDLAPIHVSNRPDFTFDPRTRGWYRDAIARGGPVLTRPYAFFTTGDAGISYAHKAPAGASVVGADITLASLSRLLERQHASPSSELLLVAADGSVVARNHATAGDRIGASRNAVRLPSLAALPLAVAPALAQHMASEAAEPRFEFAAGGRNWVGSIRRATDEADASLYLAVASPVDELMANANRMRDRTLLATLAMIAVALPIAWWVASRVSRTLRRLAADASRIETLDFRDTPPAHSIVREIDGLGRALRTGRTSIGRFLEITSALAAERRVDRLIERVLVETMGLARADAAAIHLVDAKRQMLDPARYVRAGAEASNLTASIPLAGGFDASHPIARAARERTSVLVQLSPQDRAHRAWLGPEARNLGDALALLAVPLHDRAGDVIGVLSLLSDKVRAAEIRPQLVGFIEKVSGVAAIALETQRLLAEQKELLQAFIELVAAAIDAKSPYTGGHCQRVPELTKMLAQAACDARDGPFRDFRLNDDEWEAVHIASWLHDCGKVTTPEYVVDKATKLETLYDRIHEVRMRFEVLKRDAEIAYWKARCGGGDERRLAAALADECRRLDEDFAFVASCNEGGEAMDRESCERLLRIAGRSWQRTLDDRLGVSWEERARRGGEGARPLPATERLLFDAPHHIVERAPGERMPESNPWGFKLNVPAHRYNHGEVHNLLVKRGTLTDEERFKINDHIVQTIMMLDRLPFPRHLAQVPEIAGGHHERMDGRGYPRRLTGTQMSPVTRMMAIADIFEALTAVDRPYKRGKAISEAIVIMARMRDEQHIDADLFDLFLTSGAYRRYAERHLRPEQIDEIDVAAFTARATDRVQANEESR